MTRFFYIFSFSQLFPYFYPNSQSSLSHTPRPPFYPHPFIRFIYHQCFVFLSLLPPSLFLFYFFFFHRFCLQFVVVSGKEMYVSRHSHLSYCCSSAAVSASALLSLGWSESFCLSLHPPPSLPVTHLTTRHLFPPHTLSPTTCPLLAFHQSHITLPVSRHHLFHHPRPVTFPAFPAPSLPPVIAFAIQLLTSLVPLPLSPKCLVFSAPSLTPITAYSFCHVLSWPSLLSFLQSSPCSP